MDMTGLLMAHCRNYFNRERIDGTIVIDENGFLIPPDGTEIDLAGAQYVAISGSAAYDGVWRYMDGCIYEDDHTPEFGPDTFDGTVWALHPPRSFLQLCEDVASWQEKHPVSPMQSESFGAYSYTVATGQTGAITWQEAFARQLTPFWRMFTEVCV